MESFIVSLVVFAVLAGLTLRIFGVSLLGGVGVAVRRVLSSTLKRK
jgi:hypothetical protein